MEKKSKCPKIWISLDLEMNNDVLLSNKESDDTEDNGFGKLVISDIIQIGACAIDISTGEIVGKFNAYVKLPKDKKLTPKIITLTGITEEILETQGKSLYLAYKEFEFFVKQYDYFTDALSWGGNDAGYLFKELIKKCNFKEKFIFGSIYIDIKKMYQAYQAVNGGSLRSGLGKSLSRIGRNFIGRQHHALDDSINAGHMFIFLINFFRK